jgi:leucyl-tRNA synthetase
VVRPPEGEPGLADGVCFTGDGTAIHSGPIDGLPSAEAKRKTIELLEAAGAGEAKVNYKLRDWLFSRQRYWGEPFPVLHRPDGTHLRVPDEDLPVLLPEMDDFSPSADGSAPLARAREWVETTDPDGGPARRDTDTMPGWAGSCWYWLRFMDPANDAQAWSPEAEGYWGPVDLYVGGAAHAVMHLLYARFWHKVLYDLGLVSTEEPFQRLFNQGLITAMAYRDATGRLVPNAEVEQRGDKYLRAGTGEELEQFVTKMAKQLGNVVNPDDIIAEYGADTLRLYESFMGPLADEKPWNPRDISGCRRFVERVWRLFVDEESSDALRPELRVDQQASALEGPTVELERSLNRALKRVDDSFAHLNFNTAIAALMSFVNDATKRSGALNRGQAERTVLALAPFAPHLAEELWSRLGNEGSVTRAPWPEVDPAFLEDDVIEMAVQVKGKLRGRVKVPRDADQAAVEAAARAAVAQSLEGAEVFKTIHVPGKLVNFLVR